MPWVAVAVMAASALMQASAAQKSAANQAAALNFKARIAENNAVAAEQNAEHAMQAGQAQAETQSLKNRAAMGHILARQGASGVDVNTGSAVDVREGAREAGVLDVENVIHNAQLQAYGYRSHAENFRNQGQLYGMESGFAIDEGNTASKVALLKGASSIAGAYGGGAAGAAAGSQMASPSKTWSPDWGGIE